MQQSKTLQEMFSEMLDMHTDFIIKMQDLATTQEQKDAIKMHTAALRNLLDEEPCDAPPIDHTDLTQDIIGYNLKLD